MQYGKQGVKCNNTDMVQVLLVLNSKMGKPMIARGDKVKTMKERIVSWRTHANICMCMLHTYIHADNVNHKRLDRHVGKFRFGYECYQVVQFICRKDM